MKLDRHRWIILLAIAIAAGGALWLWQRNKELRYQGKTVLQWLETAKPGKNRGTNNQWSFSVRDHKELRQTLDALGSNAAPSLIRILEDSDSSMTKFNAAVVRSKWAPASLKSAASAGLSDSMHTSVIASDGIRYLGSNAAHVIPDLERITCDPGRPMAASSACNALTGFGLQALPVLRRLLTNVPPSRQQMVHVVIQRVYRWALRSEDPLDRETAALGLSEYPRPPFEIIQILLDILESPDPRRQKQSLNALAVHLPTMAPLLVVAREAVTKMAASEDPETRRLANQILADLRHHDSKQKP